MQASSERKQSDNVQKKCLNAPKVTPVPSRKSSGKLQASNDSMKRFEDDKSEPKESDN